MIIPACIYYCQCKYHNVHIYLHATCDEVFDASCQTDTIIVLFIIPCIIVNAVYIHTYLLYNVYILHRPVSLFYSSLHTCIIVNANITMCILVLIDCPFVLIQASLYDKYKQVRYSIKKTREQRNSNAKKTQSASQVGLPSLLYVCMY